MSNMTVDSSIRYQSHQMQCRIIFLNIFAGCKKCLILKEISIFNGLRNLCKFLVNDTSGTHIHMSYL